MKYTRFFCIVIAFLLSSTCQKATNTGKTKQELGKGGSAKMTIDITSSAFQNEGNIPQKYTCDGANVSPPLTWSSIPDGTKSIALIADDPDAPVGTWVHWVLFNIPPDARGLPENVPAVQTLDSGAVQGTNDFKKLGYGGPCPPAGSHRYFFKIYALDTQLDLEPGASKAQVEDAMEGHILAQGQLMGRYER